MLGALDDVYGVPVLRPDATGDELVTALGHAIEHFRPDGVLDLTDEPVLSPADRFRLASVALERGVTFRGADFELRPPSFADVLTKPSIRVFATGKRTGKTAVASALARHAVERGREPVIVAVGRGGPEPAARDRGRDDARHEDAARDGRRRPARVERLRRGRADVRCRRRSAVCASAAGSRARRSRRTSSAAARMARGTRRGSRHPRGLRCVDPGGRRDPPASSCVPRIARRRRRRRTSTRTAYCWPIWPLLRWPNDGSAAATTTAAIHGSAPGLDVIHVVFRPEPLADVNGRKAFFCTTAPTGRGECPEDAPGARAWMRGRRDDAHALGSRGVEARPREAAPRTMSCSSSSRPRPIDVAARTARRAGHGGRVRQQRRRGYGHGRRDLRRRRRVRPCRCDRSVAKCSET